MSFVDRRDAGRRLASRLAHLRGQDVVVLGLPRGGVPVAAEVADALDAPLDVVVVRKLGVPWQPELAMGAIGEGAVRVLDEDLVRRVGASAEQVVAVEEAEGRELERRVARYRDRRRRVSLEGRVVVVVDDGLATGSTARAACQVVRALGAARVVLAVPVAPHGWEQSVATDVDEAIALETPRLFHAIGAFYRDFSQVGDEEVLACLASADARQAEGVRSDDVRSEGVDTEGVRSEGVATDGVRSDGVDTEVVVPVERADGGSVHLPGHLRVPAGAYGLVVFAHGSGSSRLSPRNRLVADRLHAGGLGTLLVDLLTEQEAQVVDPQGRRTAVFDVEALAGRLTAVTAWVRALEIARDLQFGWFGASTGAAAALWAASLRGADVAAVVSRGGRPDLAARRLYAVTAPTLLLVGGADELVLDLNRQAAALMRCPHELVVVPDAGHLFEEEGALEVVADHARRWFARHLLPG